MFIYGPLNRKMSISRLVSALTSPKLSSKKVSTPLWQSTCRRSQLSTFLVKFKPIEQNTKETQTKLNWWNASDRVLLFANLSCKQWQKDTNWTKGTHFKKLQGKHLHVNAQGTNLIELTCILYTFCQPKGFYGSNHMPS